MLLLFALAQTLRHSSFHLIFYITGDQQLLAFLKEELNYEKQTLTNLEKPKLETFNQLVS